MAYLDPNEAFEHLRAQTSEALATHFPLKGKTQTVFLDGFDVGTDVDPDDIRLQHQRKIEGGTLTVPLYGKLRLVDNATGKVVDERKLRLAELPKMTQRYSYIVGGREYQIDNQWQLKPGAYTRRASNGTLKTQFNVANGMPFDVTFDPAKKEFQLNYKKSHPPLYPFLKAMGVSDDAIEQVVGKEVLEANRSARAIDGALEGFHKSTARSTATVDKQGAINHFVDMMKGSKLRPEATELTLGKPLDHVNGEALLLSMKKLMAVQAGQPVDDRDSLVFKNLRTAADFAADKVRAHGKAVKAKTNRHLNSSTSLRDIIPPGLFNAPIRDAFSPSGNSAARVASQINPVEMLGSNSQTTILGPGGIQGENTKLDDAKLINQSHLGFLDPIVTPEGSKTGVNLRLPMGLRKDGMDAKLSVYNLKTKAFEHITAGKFLTSKVVLPDQVEWKNNKPTPLSATVSVAAHDNQTQTMAFGQADYVMRHPSQLFSVTSNLIPFLNNTSGNRASMATRHIEQAISLVNREAPLVQVGTGVAGQHDSFERVVGKYAAHTSPIAGEVMSVKADGIIIRGADGVKKEVQLYNHFPLNDSKSTMHSTPLVKVGDRVAAGQTVADTNYSRNGTLALGVNLVTAFVPMKGLNFEDGVVISESAAKKLASQHLHKNSMPTHVDTVLSKAKFLTQHPGVYKKTQLEHIGDDGVAKVGSKVRPGDPLITAMRPYDIKHRTSADAYRKAAMGTHVDNSMRWEGEVEGEVVSVHHGKDGVQVHVKTIEPMQVGDKLAGRYGNKGIVSMVAPDHEMPHMKNGQHVEIAMNPTGVPGRMNPSQLLETAASKIADKTGKTYVVQNFTKDADMVRQVQKELKKHGLTDTEELVDPVSGQSMGQIMVGKQHVLKLVHQVDKKVAIAPGMGLVGLNEPSSYDQNLQSKSGQRSGSLGIYALLAHGSTNILREMQTYKGEGEHSETDPAKRWKSQHNEVWNSIQLGTPLPTPKPTFAFQKFLDLMKGSGINVEKHGHEFVAMPLTDKHIMDLAKDRIITKPGERLEAKVDKNTGELKPRAGGLFDPKATGGHGGRLWSRIPLAEPLPNPIFEAPIKSLLGLKRDAYQGILDGSMGVNARGEVVAKEHALHLGGHAFEHMLKRIDVPTALETAKKDLASARPDHTDRALKKVKYLQALTELGMKPDEAYIMKNLPVIPPALRPTTIMKDGNISFASVTELYKDFGLVNDKLKDPQMRHAPEMQAQLRKSLYDGLQAISGFGVTYDDQKNKGLLHQIAGSSPKCFDGETEVLTVGGWVRFDQYDGRSALATVNLEADRFDWQEPQAFHVTRYQGEMHHLLGRDVDLLVTPNHNHVLAKSSSKAGKRVWGAWQLTPSEDLFGPQNRSRLMTAPKNWTGLRHEYAFEGMRVDRLAFASFVGWWLAEGWLAHTRHVYVPQSSPAGIYLLDELMPRLGLAFQRKDYVKEACATGSVTYWWLKNRQLYDWLAENIGQGAENKFLSFEVLSWESDMLRALLEGYLQGDGDNSTHALKKQGSRRTHQRGDRLGRRFSTTSRRLVDDLQQLALKIGLRVSAPKLMQKIKAHHLQQYRATVLGFRDVSFGEHLRPHRVDFDGWVYGPTVPNGTVIVRRNGQVSVSGNSGFFQKRVVQKRQDLTMRSTISPAPELGLDEVGLPKEHALDLFRPFVVRKLQDMGYASNPLDAQKVLAQRGAESFRALEKVMAERPVLVKRDPALHKYSFQGFQPRMVEGNTVKLHPLVCGGFNADFDGDSTLGEVFVVAIDPEIGDKNPEGFNMPHIGSIAAARVVNLENFPRIEESARVNARGVTEYKVPAGTYVPAYLNGSMRMMEVTEYSVHPNCEEWLVETARGRELLCSRDHSLALLDPETLEVVKKSPRESEGLCLPTLRNLEEPALTQTLLGREVTTSTKIKPMVGEVVLDRRVGWFLGATIGDGWVTNTTRPEKFLGKNKETSEALNRQLHLAYGRGGESVANMWSSVVRDLLPSAHIGVVHNDHQFDGKDCTSFRLTCSTTPLGLWVEDLIGKGAHFKHLPKDFLTFPLECRQGIFCGLIDTDGTLNWSSSKAKPQFQCSMTTVSKELADGVQLLAHSLGIVSNRTMYMNRDKEAYLVTFSSRTIQDAGWLELHHETKARVLSELRAQDTLAHGRGDIVPLPTRVQSELLDHLRTLGAAKRERDVKQQAAFSQYVVLKKSNGAITRISAEKLSELVGVGSRSDYLSRWFSLALDPTLGWDLVTAAKKTGEKKTMYDLTVPEAWTFTMVNGAVVWDTMAVYVPVSKEAVAEAHKMKPTNNLFSEATGGVVYAPTLESSLGIYKLGIKGKDTKHKFDNPGKLLESMRVGTINATDVVHLNGKATTAGRVLLASSLPTAMQNTVLHDLDVSLDRKGLNSILTTLGKNHKEQYDKSVNMLKDIGNHSTYGAVAIPLPGGQSNALAPSSKQVFLPTGGHTLSLKDFETDHVMRDAAYGKADKEVLAIRKGAGTAAEKNFKIIEAYTAAGTAVKSQHEHKMDAAPNNLFTMYRAGIKPGWDQYKQLVLAPGLVEDSQGRIVPIPIKKSYAEGLDVAGYWTQMHGARAGAVKKVQEVRDPGYMSKLLLQSMMDQLVASPDCGTKRGVLLSVDEKDVHDRVLTQDFKAGNVHVPTGTILTPNVVGTIKAADKNARLMVRSPIKCEHASGICQRCIGLSSNGSFHDIGTNIGIQAAQTVGERAVQLTLKAFHEGGAVKQGGNTKVLGAFERFQQLTLLPDGIPNSAALAMKTGKVESIKVNPTGVDITIGGKKHFVGKDETGHDLHRPMLGSKWGGIAVGQNIVAGQSLSDPSRTYVDPHQLYRATKSMDHVQHYLTDEIYNLYRDEGIKRRHVEMTVKAMSNLTKVVDPGDSSGILHGEMKPVSSVHALNKELMATGKRPVEHAPVLKGVMMLPLDMQEDWIAKLQHQNLHKTMGLAAATGARSNLHGTHPIPGLAYGAEFGLNANHSKQPGREHLAKVPGHHY